MNRPILALGFWFALAFSALAQGGPSASVADIAERLSPAVVNISTTQAVENRNGGLVMPELPENSPFRDLFEEFFKNQQRNGGAPVPRKVNSLGSGFIIDPTGLVVTNNHVIEDADEVEVSLPDGRALKAKVLGKDSKTDLALLKVESDKPLPFVPFGNSERLRVGDWVIAIGNPFGLGGSVTLGIVSARNRDINAGAYDDFIQTDAAINRGNSGGPLFDINGNVVGVNTAIISPSGGSIGIGFAVPSNTAAQVIDQLRQYGETRRGWLGVKIQMVTPEIADTLGLGSPRGALVSEVIRTGPAEMAGILSGDVITSFNGKSIGQMRDLPRMVANTPVGLSVPVILQRKGRELSVTVKLGRLEEGEKIAASQEVPDQVQSPAPQAAESDVLGMKLSELTPELRSQFSVPDAIQGVVVTEVDAASSAQERNIEPGDVITEAGEKMVKSPKDIETRVAELRKEGKSNILLLLSKTSRQGEMRFVPLKLQ